MRKRKELVSDISKGENSSTISADNYLRPTELSPRRSNESNWSESIYPPGGTRNPIRKTQTVFRCVPIFQIRGKQICGAVCFPFPGADMPLNQCEVNVLGCIRIHQASGEWRVEMTVFRFVVCGHTHIHTHREIQSAGWEYTRSLGEVKGGVNRFGIAGTQRSRKKTYSIPITRLIRPNPPVFRRGRQSRFPFYRSPPPPPRVYDGRWIHPFCAPGVATTLPVFATRSSISSLHTRNPGIPAKSRAISRYSTCYPQACPIPAPIPRICQLVYSSWSTSSRLPSPLPTRVRGFLKTYCRQQPNRASFLLPFRPLPILHRPSSLIPIFLIHAHRASNGVERFTRFRVYHLATLHFSPSFQSFTVFSPCCFPPAGFIRLNSRLAFCYRWLDWMVASARRTHQWVEWAQLLDQSRPVGSISKPVRYSFPCSSRLLCVHARNPRGYRLLPPTLPCQLPPIPLRVHHPLYHPLFVSVFRQFVSTISWRVFGSFVHSRGGGGWDGRNEREQREGKSRRELERSKRIFATVSGRYCFYPILTSIAFGSWFRCTLGILREVSIVLAKQYVPLFFASLFYSILSYTSFSFPRFYSHFP